MKLSKQDLPEFEEGLVGAQDESDKSLSLMGGIVRPEGLPEMDEFGLDSGKPQRKVLTQGTMLMLLVFVIAAGTLWGMRLSQREAAASKSSKEVEKKIDDALKKFGAATGPQAPMNPTDIDKILEGTDAIVEVFATDAVQRQVPIEQIKKNPFVLPIFGSAQSGPDPLEMEGMAAMRQQETLRREMEGMKLQSIVLGAVPVAIIDGELVQVGQHLGSFVVRRINQMSVDLEFGGQVLVLKMEDDEPARGVKARGGRGGR